jgi:hypothetical protein
MWQGVLLLGATTLALLPAPVLAQDHGHAMPAPAPAPVQGVPPMPEACNVTLNGNLVACNPPGTLSDSPPDRPAGDHAVMAHGAVDHGSMKGMDMAGMNMAAMTMTGQGSGTSRLPPNEKMGGTMVGLGGQTMLMVHGYIWPIYTDTSGPRGGDKLYVQSMGMAMLTAPFTGGKVTLTSMMSLEPAMKHTGYPNLFATGEEAYGKPLVDRQHPHDLFMELSGRLDLDVAGKTTVFLYGGPVAEPALGPSAFMHRASGKYNPEAPITHHWFDSTHITYGVVTAGVSAPKWQLEASAFRGREPDEFRWTIETPRLDSWSLRASFAPSPSWLLQASYGELHSPEAAHPGEDEHRATVSAQYNDGRGLSAMAAFSAKDRAPGGALTAWLGEVNWDLTKHHTLFGRIENVDNDELFPDHASPLHDVAFRVTKFQAGYAYRLPLGPVNLALGGTASAFAKPAALDAAYGRSPLGYTVFAKFSLGD